MAWIETRTMFPLRAVIFNMTRQELIESGIFGQVKASANLPEVLETVVPLIAA